MNYELYESVLSHLKRLDNVKENEVYRYSIDPVNVKINGTDYTISEVDIMLVKTIDLSTTTFRKNLHKIFDDKDNYQPMELNETQPIGNMKIHGDHYNIHADIVF